ncbi:MFS transporter [Ktedonobacter racemifer]|uniref:Putative proline/betaine transporter n=1 Tax=Ktedonobacter racemifer DSM 44963 TaxID=485913 RepID=D6U199_KTERA|nr:MFS transporter [Ktedonobacter racemifer]EFH82589.1 major facilitator superfamily MFS_1 [Ktedonobacter racemifer DSM 44963]
MATANDNIARSRMGPVIFSSTLGTAIEWYDFFLYGTMATLVFPKLFFPGSNQVVGTLLSLFTFLVGFIARPFGGALFGHLGDRIGRKSTLIATLLLMGISTLLIGFLPGYTAIGIAAPVILVLLRLGQGLGVGGEWGGSVLLALEYGHKERRGFWASWPQMGAPLGLVLSTVVANIVQSSTGASFLDWGWRIPFFVSALLIIVGLYIRLSVLETPLFAQLKEQKREAKAPLVEAFRYSTPEILLSAGSRFIEQAPFYLFVTFVITYGLDKLALDKTFILNAITVGSILEMITIPLFGHLSDRFGRRKWYLIGCVLMALFAFPYFLLMNAGTVTFFIAVVLSLAIFHSWVYGPQAALIAERFGTRSRYSGASLGYQLAAPFAGGLAPIIALLLLTGKNNLSALGLSKVVVNIGTGSWQAVAIYMVVLAVISFASVLGLKEMTKSDISGAEAPTANEPEITLAPAD